MWKRIRKPVFVVVGLIVLALISIQFMPVDRSNPPITMDIAAPAEVNAVLRQSCYDCHSNETRWPWYSYVAPVSWIVAQHVHMGRQHFNFSTWDDYDPEDRIDIIEEMYEEAEDGEMPLPIYLKMHSDAKLTPEDLQILNQWASGASVETDSN